MIKLNKQNSCNHPMIFKESSPKSAKWYCRFCFEEIPKSKLCGSYE
jgi:hypothetical protein